MKFNRTLKFALFIVLACSASVRAEIKLTHKGSIESDLRIAVETHRGEESYEPFHFTWNRNAFDYTLTAKPGSGIRGVANARIIYFGINEIEYLGDQTERDLLVPFRLESDALYMEARGFPLDDMDISVGRQIINWGSADQFNPTNNLNPNNHEDPLLFGQKIANQMVAVTYYLPWLEWSVQGVWVPIFAPSIIPKSAMLGIKSVEDMPVRDQKIKNALVEEYYREKEIGGSLFIDPVVRVDQPPAELNNMSGGVRTKMTLGDFDLSLSYYYGRFGYPTVKRIVAYSGDEVMTTSGPKTEQHQFVDVIYPRIQVAGADVAGSLPWLLDLGVWIEVAAYHPEKVIMRLYSVNYSDGAPCAAPGDNGTQIQMVCSVNTDKWFFKGTVGMDYTFTSWLYTNVQYVHGFVDEFGYEDAMNDYLIAGLDMKFFSETFLQRFFMIYTIQDSSMVIYPQVTYKYQPMEFVVGALFFLGDEGTKFGSKQTGRSTAFLKAKFSF